MGRAPCCDKVGMKRGRWTAEEDEKLRKYIEENGEGCWRSLSKNAGLLRCGKSCRLRWINYLRSDLKRGNISAEEEEIVINLHACLGNRWALIAAHLPGRTDNEIKNYWISHLSRKFHGFRRPNPDFIPPPPRRPDRLGGARKKKKNTDNLISSKPPNHDGEENAAVFIPTTPTPERESPSSSTQRKENDDGGVVPHAEQRESSIAFDCDLEDIVEDLNEILNRIGSRETDLCSENLMGSSPSDSWNRVADIDDNAFSWIWDDVYDGEMGMTS